MKDLILLAVCLVLAAAAIEDIAKLRISNIFPLLVMALFLPLSLIHI